MIKKLLFTFLPVLTFAQGYTSYFTGNPVNVTTTPEFGVCMMGGASEHDNAMIWLLQKANGGDVVVLRSSGSNGYNDYLYSELGVNVNSVETLVITSVAGATNPYVLDKVANAEMIWFAGGDQWNYVSYFRNNALEDLLNAHINVKHAPIGGTSAGMAILGQHYFSAQNGSVTTAQMLANPYNANATIGSGDFLSIPFIENVITDTHYDNPDRRGRQFGFMAQLRNTNPVVRGIACNEYVAVCINEDGMARVYGDYPNYEEYAYFLQSSCETLGYGVPETCAPNMPLTWNHNNNAVKVLRIPGRMNGEWSFDLNDWVSGNHAGGQWQNWWSISGTFNTALGPIPDAVECSLSINDLSNEISLSPVPFNDFMSINGIGNAAVAIYDAQGRKVYQKDFTADIVLETSQLPSGLYLVSIEKDGKILNKKVVKN